MFSFRFQSLPLHWSQFPHKPRSSTLEENAFQSLLPFPTHGTNLIPLETFLLQLSFCRKNIVEAPPNKLLQFPFYLHGPSSCPHFPLPCRADTATYLLQSLGMHGLQPAIRGLDSISSLAAEVPHKPIFCPHLADQDAFDGVHLPWPKQFKQHLLIPLLPVSSHKLPSPSHLWNLQLFWLRDKLSHRMQPRHFLDSYGFSVPNLISQSHF